MGVSPTWGTDVTTVAVALLVVLGLIALALLVVAKRRSDAGEEEPDPLFIVGITLAGAGSALVSAVGPGMISLTAVGVLLIAAGIIRTRQRPPRTPQH